MCPLHEPTRAVREVVVVLGDGECQCVPVDDVEVGERTFPHDAPVGDPERRGGVGREPPDRVLDGEQTALTHPVGEQGRGDAGVHGLTDVGTGVGEPHHDLRCQEDLADRLDVLVDQRPREQDRAIGLEREVDERLDGRHSPLVGDREQRPGRVTLVVREAVVAVEHEELVEPTSVVLRRLDELGASTRVTEHGKPLGE